MNASARELVAERALTAELYALPTAGSRRDDMSTARELFARLGTPQNAPRTVHVAGTAGKGSVTAFVGAILSAHGFEVGTYSSPHAYAFNERIGSNGAPVPHEELAVTYELVRSSVESIVAEGNSPTFFEVVTALAFAHFARVHTEYSVIETGIGGRFDCTNTIDRQDKVAVVTHIGLDHTELLGSTVEDIAAHKAGIFAAGGVAFALDQSDSVLEVLSRIALDRNCALHVSGGQDGKTRLTDTPLLGLSGGHQRNNAALALEVVQHLSEQDGWVMDIDRAQTALAATSLPGRFERRTVDGRPMILDGAHNAMKLAALTETLHQEFPGRKFVWVVALASGKEIDGAVAAVARHAHAIVATEWGTCSGVDGGSVDHSGIRSVDCTLIAERARRHGVSATSVPTVAQALERARGYGLPIVVAGSFHLLAEIAR